MAERANLLTPAIVDPLGDGEAAGDKRKAPKERFIRLPPLACSSAPGEEAIAAAGLSRCLLFAAPPPSIAPALSGAPLAAALAIDLPLREVSAFVKGRPTLFWRLICPRGGGGGELDLADVLLACQAVGGR